MSYWNHRVMRQVFTPKMTPESSPYIIPETTYRIYEVYYDEDTDAIGNWATDADPPTGDTIEELRIDIERFAKALEKPILDYDTGKPINKTEDRDNG